MSAVFAKVLDMSLTASFVILVVLVVRLFLQKAPKVISYALWTVVLFRLLCPVSLSAPVSLLEATQPRVTVNTAGTSHVSYLPENLISIPAPENATGMLLEVPNEIPAREPDVKRETNWNWLTMLSWVWLAGAAVMVLHSIVSYRQLRRCLAEASQIKPRVFLADGIPTPFVMGILKPEIYLPSDTPTEAQEYILAHERHHIRRGDHVIKLLAYASLCVHWFNPLVWISFFLANKDMEMSCDEAVVRKLGPEIRADYAQTLINMASNRPIIAGIPLAFGEGDTKSRVRNIVKWKQPKIWGFLVSVVLCILAVVVCAVNPKGDDEAHYLEKCRSVLESLQSETSYSVKILRSNYGDVFLNDSTTSAYFQHGENWLLTHKIPESGFDSGFNQFGYMTVDGKCFNNVGRGMDENGEVNWAPAQLDDSELPWIATFDWNAQDVRYISKMPAGNGLCITLRVMGAYNASNSDAYPYYQMQFIFNENGEFERIENTFYFHNDREGDYSAKEAIQFIRDSAENAIAYEYQRYLNANG